MGWGCDIDRVMLEFGVVIGSARFVVRDGDANEMRNLEAERGSVDEGNGARFVIVSMQG